MPTFESTSCISIFLLDEKGKGAHTPFGTCAPFPLQGIFLCQYYSTSIIPLSSTLYKLRQKGKLPAIFSAKFLSQGAIQENEPGEKDS
jgi:hypothetical protein